MSRREMLGSIVRSTGRSVFSVGGMFLLTSSAIVGVAAGGMIMSDQSKVSRVVTAEKADAVGQRSADGHYQQSAVLQSSDGWLSESYWKRKRLKKQRQRNSFSGRSNVGVLNPFAESGSQLKAVRRPSPFDGGTVRTVCVRLCDGYYFPISFSTTRNRLARDEQACKSRCGAPSRLYYYKTADGSPDTMIDRRGRAYADMKTAFLYRTRYDKSCQCRAEPWSDEAKERHAMYETKDWQKKARRVAKRASRKSRIASVDATQQTSATIAASAEAYLAPLAQRNSVQGRQRGQSRYRNGRMSLGQRPVSRQKVRSAPRAQPRAVKRRRRVWRSRALYGSSDS